MNKDVMGCYSLVM